MKKSTKNTYKTAKKGNYKVVVRMAEGGNVSELNYSERREYIEEHYVPFISDAQMIFTIWNSGLDYDMFADKKMVSNQIISHYEKIADYTEESLPIETVYAIKDWDLVRRDIDPETDDVIDEVELEQVSSDNTYNFSYRGLVDLNWRVYYDDEFERYFYVIMPHLGGDIRGNYGNAIILEGNDKEELFYRFYEDFISGGASVYLKFNDGSEVSFDSEQDSDVFYFRLNDSFEPTGMAQKYLNDFEKFDSWQGDEFLEETVQLYLMRNGVATKMMSGGRLDDETPRAYFQILGYNEGKWVDLSDYSDGTDLMDYIYSWMKELNEKDGGNREEYAVYDYEGFGYDMYDEYMGVNEFDEIIEAYDKFKDSNFPSSVVNTYVNESGNSKRTLLDTIDTMNDSFVGVFEKYEDFGYDMVKEGYYTLSMNDVYITKTDKRLLAGDEADSIVGDMDFEDVLAKADNTKEEYEEEKNKLEERYEEISDEISDLEELQKDADILDDYERISNEIEKREIELEEIRESLDNIDDRFEDNARREALDVVYNEIYDRLENDLEGWLDEYGYADTDLEDISFLSINYESIGEELSNDYLVIEDGRDLYFFQTYEKGGRVKASKTKPKYEYYIVENSTKKLVSGYNSKQEAVEQRKLLINEYPSLRFEIYTLGNLESKTDLDVYDKEDYVKLSTLDKIKKVSVDAYRYGKEKTQQANEFLVRNDVKGRIKRGGSKVWEKTKQGGNWLKRQWEEADFGDGKGKAKFFDDGGGVEDKNEIPKEYEKYVLPTRFQNLRYSHEKSNWEGNVYLHESDVEIVTDWIKDELHNVRVRFLTIKKIPNIGFLQVIGLKDDVLRSKFYEYAFRIYSNFTMDVNTLQDYTLSNKQAKGIKESIFLYEFSEESLHNKKFDDGGGVYRSGGTLEYIDSKYTEEDAEKLVKELQESGKYRRVQKRKNKKPTHTPTGKISKRGSAGVFWRIYAEPLFSDGGGVDSVVNKYEQIIDFLKSKGKYVYLFYIDDVKELYNVDDEKAYYILQKVSEILLPYQLVKKTIHYVAKEYYGLEYEEDEKRWYGDGGGVDDKKTNYEVSLKNDKHYGEVGVSLYGWQLDDRGRNYLTLQFKNGSVSTYGEGEVKVVVNNTFNNGGDVLTKPIPITTPAPTKTPAPSKPDKDNPYKPKTTPRPKAGSVDFIMMYNK